MTTKLEEILVWLQGDPWVGAVFSQFDVVITRSRGLRGLKVICWINGE